ncbi:MAG: hypothetical protein PHI84_19880 [Kiritimatiellae bacterium]|nr:hypothetical protein [Kiritimatiellia bacterium]
MRRRKMAIVLCASLLIGGATCHAEGNHRFGVGANYWTAVKNIDVHDIDEDGMSWLATYQYASGSPLSLEANLEVFKEGFAGSPKNVYAPQAFVLVGCNLYAGAGIGIYYSDDEFADKPFYAVKVGLDLKLLPSLYLDINANYRFNKWKNISELADEIDSDTIILGAALRLAF